MEFINKSSLIKLTNGIAPNETIYNMYHSLVRQKITQKIVTQKIKQYYHSLF